MMTARIALSPRRVGSHPGRHVMSFPYTIQSGDTLSRIAQRNGLASWKEIYFLPENAPFRARRPNPDLIFPGDIVLIPGDDPNAPPPPPPSPLPPPSPAIEP